MFFSATLQVVYTDYNIALVYLCYARESNGNCNTKSVHVSLLSRHQQINDNQRQQLVSRLDNQCVHESDLIKADQG